MLTVDEKREQVLENIRELAEGLVREDPDIIKMVSQTHIRIGELALVFEETLRKIIPLPLEDGYEAGQAAHKVRSEKMHAHVAEMAAGA